jgi:SAM-dependent methyltransferase
MAEDPAGGYDAVFFDRLAPIEDSHFWFRARNQLIFSTIRRLVEIIPPHACILEVGCGTGNTLRWLKRAYGTGSVLGMDLWLEGLRYAKERTDCLLVQGDIRCPPFARSFHIIGLFDVLEHLQDDREVLARLRELLVPGGWLVLTVPARPSLWSYFDEASRHCRRYSTAQLTETLAAAGYDPCFVSEFMAPLLPLVWLWRKCVAPLLGRRKTVSEAALREFRIIPGVNGFFTWLLSWEARRIARGRRSPFGVSLLAVARA